MASFDGPHAESNEPKITIIVHRIEVSFMALPRFLLSKISTPQRQSASNAALARAFFGERVAPPADTVYKYSYMAALEEVLQKHPVWRGAALAPVSGTISTGYAGLDRELPGGGWPAGALTELLGPARGNEPVHGIGELQLVLPALAALSTAGKRIVWLAPPHLPYAPALAAAGVDLAHLAVVRAPGRRDALWAAEQVLRAGPCHALLAWFRHARYEELRRLAVAAEASRAMIVLFRPSAAASEPSPAGLRLALEPVEGALSLKILKRRGAPAAAPIRLAVKRPVHALGRSAFQRTSFQRFSDRDPREPRRLGLPVHA